ncbi:TetR family transcriptional regulator [Anaerocolumna cellulosilytica]|uniref:TetR family transcriptional regulator n=1 Tax=Anaerocolumna cellulosilytica TaxID=433286 RepID=A0A6S6R177_9FIRM|nr:TetR/AcrR family transcriptional regulator [Anaerocolumna cellulosilytica]MBB5195573.1 AcrR family transcriptional regulator [Anaerocolumna cellulosilytica]BCJ93817.1 TetR family transcriptional regulator [Anaerocolumna cellulosilytica]
MRVVKDANERKEEILDAAQELFIQKGFDGTSTNEILDKVKIARGTLYYHFKSKEDIMDALIERLNQQILTSASKIAGDKSISLEEKLIRVILSLNISGDESKEIIEHMHKPQNALMHQKMQSKVVSGITPILTDLVREGMEAGFFNTPYPYESIEMIMIYANVAFDSNESYLIEEQRKNKELAFIYHIERLLGAKEGSLKFMRNMFENRNEAYNE